MPLLKRRAAPAPEAPKPVAPAKVIKTPSGAEAKAQLTEAGLVITLPAKAARYLGIDRNPDSPLFVTPVNGVLQVSAHEPAVSIPAVALDLDSFEGQTA